MARYDAQINILLSGQKRLEELTGQLYEIEDSITRIQRGWQAASANLNRATRVANVFGRTQPRGEGGRFAPDPDRKQRLAALAAERRARTNARLLRLDLSLAEKRAGYARQELESGSRLIQQTERRVALESRLNSAVTIFQRQQRAFARGGGGVRLPQDLQQKAADAQAAFKAAGGPLARNLQLVQALAREMTTIAEAQREINRGSSLASKGFEAGRRLQERIDVISRQNVVSPEKIRRLRGGATQAIAASFRGDQQEYSEALRRASAAVRRVERESNKVVKETRRIAGLAPRSPVRGGINFPGSPRALEEQRRAQERALLAAQKGYPSSPIMGTATMQGSPRFLAAQERARAASEKALQAQERAAKVAEKAANREAERILKESQRGYPSSPILGSPSMIGSPRYLAAQERLKKALEREVDRSLSEAKRGYPSSPILGAATVAGSPRWKAAQEAARAKLEKAASAAERAADRALKEAQKGYPSSPILGTASIAGSPRYLAAQEKARATAERVMRAQERAAKAAQSEAERALSRSQKGYPASPILGTPSMVGSPRYIAAQERAAAIAERRRKAQESAAERAARKQERAAAAAERAADRALAEAQKGFPSSPILGSASMTGSPRFLAAQERARAAAERAANAVQRAANKALSEAQKGFPSSPILGSPSMVGSPRWVKAQEAANRKLEQAAKATERAAEKALQDATKGFPSSPIRGGVNLPGSPIFNETPFLERRFSKRGSAAISEGLIGGVFPLLFGQGIGAAAFGGLGGALGGFAGGGLGFGLSLLGTALGDVYDRLIQGAQETGKSLNYPIEGFEKLKEAGFFASRQQEYHISKLIESGRTAEATAQIQAEMIRKIGVTGVNDLMRLGDASSDLSKAWAEFNLQLQAALAGPMAGLLKWVTAIVATANQSFKSQRLVEDVSAGLSGKEKERFDFEIDRINNSEQIGQVFGPLFGGLSSQEARKQRNALAMRYAPLIKPAERESTKPDPKQQEADLRKAMENAEKIRSLNQQGLNLQRSADELRRNNEDTVYGLRKRAADMEREAADFRRSIEDEIFNKRQELERMLIENDRKRKQNAIDTVDLQLQELASGLDPVAAGVVDAGREYVRFIGEALADKEQRERNLALDLVQMQREADKFKLQVEDRVRQMNEQRDEFTRDVTRTKTQMEFAALDYAKQVEDYRLQMAQRRLELAIEEGNVTKAAAIAAQEGLTVEPSGAGYTGSKVDGFPITSRPGMRRHPITGEMRKHKGVDIAAPVGTALGYEIGGKILSAGWIRGYGNTLKVELENGMTVLSAHLNEIFVEAGQKFRANQRLATVGSTGNSTGPHTHQESWINGKADPYASLPYLQLGKAVSGRPAAQAPTSRVGRAQASASAMGLPIPPSPPPLPALPTAPRAAGIGDLLQIDNSVYQKMVAARKEGNKIEEEALQIRIKQGQAALVEKAMQPVKAIQERTQSIYDEIEARKLRNKLTAEGVAPEIIEGMLRAAEIEKEFNQLIAGQDALLEELNKGKRDGATAAYEAALARITELGTIKELTPELLKEKKALEGILRVRKAIQDAKPGAIKGAEDAAAASILSPSERIEKEYGDAKQSLEKLIGPVNQVISAAQAIGSAFGSAFSDLITGSASASEALGRMFRSISESFANMAAQIIAEWIRMQVLGIIKSIFSAAANSGGFSFGGPSGGFDTPGFELPPYMQDIPVPPPGTFANGGVFDSPALERFASGGMFTNSIVSSPTLFKFADGGTMKTGLMGEAGAEAILPLKRGANGQLGVQMVGPARQFAANRATLDSSTSDTSAGDPLMESRQALAVSESNIRNRQIDRSIEKSLSAPNQSLKIEYDSQVINNIEYVTSDQFQRGMSQAAERGRALTLGALKNSVKARRQVGI